MCPQRAAHTITYRSKRRLGDKPPFPGSDFFDALSKRHPHPREHAASGERGELLEKRRVLAGRGVGEVVAASEHLVAQPARGDEIADMRVDEGVAGRRRLGGREAVLAGDAPGVDSGVPAAVLVRHGRAETERGAGTSMRIEKLSIMMNIQLIKEFGKAV